MRLFLFIFIFFSVKGFTQDCTVNIFDTEYHSAQVYRNGIPVAKGATYSLNGSEYLVTVEHIFHAGEKDTFFVKIDKKRWYVQTVLKHQLDGAFCTLDTFEKGILGFSNLKEINSGSVHTNLEEYAFGTNTAGVKDLCGSEYQVLGLFQDPRYDRLGLIINKGLSLGESGTLFHDTAGIYTQSICYQTHNSNLGVKKESFVTVIFPLQYKIVPDGGGIKYLPW